MPNTTDAFLTPFSPFALGFYLGLIFLFIALYNLLRIKSELSRFRRHLSDKLEIEADTMKKIKGEQDNLRRENESLRIKVNSLNELPDRKLQRDLEIYARAEKKMLVSVPGFAPAWETAKAEGHTELMEEESGRSAPRRIFSRLFGGGSGAPVALPQRAGEQQGHTADMESSSQPMGKGTVTNDPGAGV